jgi:hypothetical protein
MFEMTAIREEAQEERCAAQARVPVGQAGKPEPPAEFFGVAALALAAGLLLLPQLADHFSDPHLIARVGLRFQEQL